MPPNESVKSPYQLSDFPHKLSKEKLEEVRKILDVSCCFLIIQDKRCDCKDSCVGHYVEVGMVGFTKPNVHQILHNIIEDDHKKFDKEKGKKK